MELVQSGVSLSFEVTYDSPALNVGMIVFDDDGLTPVQVGSLIHMLNFVGSSYRGKFTPESSKNYLVHKAVYTDNTYTTIDSDFPESSESFRAEDLVGNVGTKAFEVVTLFDEDLSEILVVEE